MMATFRSCMNSPLSNEPAGSNGETKIPQSEGTALHGQTLLRLEAHRFFQLPAGEHETQCRTHRVVLDPPHEGIEQLAGFAWIPDTFPVGRVGYDPGIGRGDL